MLTIKTPSRVIIGLDPSTTTGLVAIRDNLKGPGMVGVLTSERTGILRVNDIANLFSLSIANLRTENPDSVFSVFIESYPFNNRFTLATLVEIGGALRQVCAQLEIPWFTVNPKTLKRLTAGTSKADKKAMAKAVYEKWGWAPPKLKGQKTDDMVDAYALAMYGRGYFQSPKQFPAVPFGSATTKAPK